MSEIIREAKTIEIAVQAALKELNCEREDVDIEIIQEPAKGIFGLTKFAKVKVTLKKDFKDNQLSNSCNDKNNEEINEEGVFSQESEAIKQVLLKILELINVKDAKIKIAEDDENIFLSIDSSLEGLLIGRHGQTLSSLQYLLNKMIKSEPERIMKRIIVDVGGYREKHQVILERIALRVAKRVAITKEEEQLKAMSAFDRRIIHMMIKDNPEVTTYSLGEGNFRRVVIAPRKKENNQASLE